MREEAALKINLPESRVQVSSKIKISPKNGLSAREKGPRHTKVYSMSRV
jgi:hypothetical protein